MSTTKRLAKRSIIGTRVCAPGPDGKYYCGVISAVNTPASPHQPEPQGGLNITPDTRYSVRFDPVPASYCQGKPPDNKAEFSDRDLIGPGFGSVTSARLLTGQRVFLTYNGREIQAEVVQHREHLDEVDVVFAAPSGQEGTISLTKRIDEVRLLESRKSARLADSDTDFARLADMGSDRKRASSNSIDVPHVIGSRKRRPSSSNDSERSYNGNQLADSGSYMDECSAAMVLMSLSTPPKNPLPIHCQQHYGSWDDGVSTSSNRVVVGSPGVGGTSNSSSSSSTSSGASYRSGTPSPPLSDEGNVLWPSSSNGSSASSSMANSAPLNHHHPHHSHPHLVHHPHPAHSQRYYQYHQPIHHHHQQADGSSSSSPNFTYDEGIVPDLDLDRPRKKRIRCRVNYDDCTRDSPNAGSSSDNEVKPMTIYRCTWRTGENRNIRCGETGSTWEVVAEHVLRTHLNGQNTTDHEEDFYIVDEQLEPACSPPTKSHWDMVRPRSEDPEYQKQLRLAASPNNQNTQSSAAVNTQDIIIRDVFSISSQFQRNTEGLTHALAFDPTELAEQAVQAGASASSSGLQPAEHQRGNGIAGQDASLAPPGAWRDQEVPQGVRHGAQGALVHAVQMEEGVHAFQRLERGPRAPSAWGPTPAPASAAVAAQPLCRGGVRLRTGRGIRTRGGSSSSRGAAAQQQQQQLPPPIKLQPQPQQPLRQYQRRGIRSRGGRMARSAAAPGPRDGNAFTE